MSALMPTAVLVALAVVPLAGQIGKVTSVQIAAGVVDVGEQVSFTVTGDNPCGAVEIAFGDGNAITYAITGLPHTVRYAYKRAGTFTVTARGQGRNCQGRAAATPRMIEVRAVAAPPPSARRRHELDLDGDGAISRAEWPAARGTFSTYDWNRDGILSGDEIRAVQRDERREDRERAREREAPGDAMPPIAIRVRGDRVWTDTGLLVQAGDRLRFEATGQIRLSDRRDDFADARGARSGRRAPGAPLPGLAAGRLIARIDDGPAFDAGGPDAVLHVDRDGRLHLGVNDADAADNSGVFDVRVTITRRR